MGLTGPFLRNDMLINAINAETRFMQDALSLRAYRQQVLASNIANADTPNFKARDVDFAKELQRIQGAQEGRLSLSTSAPGHLQPRGGDLGTQLLYRSAVQPSIDGNTVDMDVERGQFADNAIHYQFTVNVLRNRFKEMLTAVTGQ
jgi:flagellar basal-body rod protein FlgB